MDPAGAIVGIQGGTEAVRRRVADLRASGAEIAGVWLQDWTGQRTTDFGDRLWWTWQLDRERYPGWERLVADLGRQGIRVTTYVNPFLVDAGPKGDPDVRNLYAEAADEHYLVEPRTARRTSSTRAASTPRSSTSPTRTRGPGTPT